MQRHLAVHWLGLMNLQFNILGRQFPAGKDGWPQWYHSKKPHFPESPTEAYWEMCIACTGWLQKHPSHLETWNLLWLLEEAQLAEDVKTLLGNSDGTYLCKLFKSSYLHLILPFIPCIKETHYTVCKYQRRSRNVFGHGIMFS